MRPLMLVALLAACSDPTKVAPAPTIGAIAGTVVSHSMQQPVAGVHVTIMSLSDTTYTALDTTSSGGTFYQNAVPGCPALSRASPPLAVRSPRERRESSTRRA